MTKQEFNAIVDDAVLNGADREEAEAYVRSGYKLGADFGREASALAGGVAELQSTGVAELEEDAKPRK